MHIKSFDKPEFARRLREARKKVGKGVSGPRGIAKAVGVHRNTYTLWEDDDSEYTPSNLNQFSKLCEALGVSPTYLLLGSEDWSLNVDDKYKEKIQEFYDRYSRDENFNGLIRMIMELKPELIPFFYDLLYEFGRYYSPDGDEAVELPELPPLPK